MMSARTVIIALASISEPKRHPMAGAFRLFFSKKAACLNKKAAPPQSAAEDVPLARSTATS